MESETTTTNIISMTDFNREADLLSEYMGYWIDHLAYQMFYAPTPISMAKQWELTGMIYYHQGHEDQPAMSFEQWKEHNGHNKVQQEE